MTLTLEGAVNTVTSEYVTALDDVEHHLDQKVSVNGREISVSQLALEGDRIHFKVEGNHASPDGAALRHANLTLSDGKGNVIWQNRWFEASGDVKLPKADGPFKLEIRVSEKTLAVPFHVVLKDLLIPPQ